MTRFASVLKQAEGRLRVPEPSRSRILLEMAADLEDSYRHFRDQGLDEAEAQRRAQEAFATSDEALELLSRLHQRGFGSVADRLLAQIGNFWSKALLVILLAFEVLFAVRIGSDRTFFVHASPFLWPVALLALGVFLFTVFKLKQILSRTGSDARRLRTGLGLPLFASGATLAVAGLGLLFHLQRFFRLNAETAPESLIRNFAGWMVSISSLMTISLLTAMFAGLVWFVVCGLVTRSEAREVESLLIGSASTTGRAS